MDKKRRLQIRILLFCVRLIDGIHLDEEHKRELNNIVEQLVHFKTKSIRLFCD